MLGKRKQPSSPYSWKKAERLVAKKQSEEWIKHWSIPGHSLIVKEFGLSPMEHVAESVAIDAAVARGRWRFPPLYLGVKVQSYPHSFMLTMRRPGAKEQRGEAVDIPYYQRWCGMESICPDVTKSRQHVWKLGGRWSGEDTLEAIKQLVEISLDFEQTLNLYQITDKFLDKTFTAVQTYIPLDLLRLVISYIRPHCCHKCKHDSK